MSKTILDEYVKILPSPQNAVDIFMDEWSSILPPVGSEALKAGAAALFEDARIKWVVETLGGVEEYTVLELGPLEGGHSYMLEKLGAASILAIEANTRAYLKCLIIKEIYGLVKVRFLLGDFVHYLRNTQNYWDLCIASGVLYHMYQPAELLELIAGHTDRALIWTHYYDYDLLSKNSNIPPDKFTGSVEKEQSGFKHTLYHQSYGEALNWAGFCGGSEDYSMWMTREGILDCLSFFGFKQIKIAFDHPDHPNGPAFCLLATK